MYSTYYFSPAYISGTWEHLGNTREYSLSLSPSLPKTEHSIQYLPNTYLPNHQALFLSFFLFYFPPHNIYRTHTWRFIKHSFFLYFFLFHNICRRNKYLAVHQALFLSSFPPPPQYLPDTYLTVHQALFFFSPFKIYRTHTWRFIKRSFSDIRNWCLRFSLFFFFGALMFFCAGIIFVCLSQKYEIGACASHCFFFLVQELGSRLRFRYRG
jgi:hypothetical protein